MKFRCRLRLLVVSVACCLAVPALAGGDLQEFLNVSGAPLAAGTVTVTLRESPGGKVIATRSSSASVGQHSSGVAFEINFAFFEDPVPGYEASMADKKVEKGEPNKSVVNIKAKRDSGTSFVVEVTEDIPGVEIEQKETGADEKMNTQRTLPRGFEGTVELLGTSTTWLMEQITGIDFGVGIATNSFAVLSNTLIVADVGVSPDAPLGPEHVQVVGVIFDGGQPFPDAVINSSLEPLVVVGPAVPTVSEWGLIALALLLLAAVTIVIRRQQSMRPVPARA